MAKDNKITIEVVTTDKGAKATIVNQKKIQKEAGKTADSLKKVGKESNAYHKKQKGIAQSNLSSAKGFSKMQQSIGGGSSGLVGAYATLAANVFAATAAFNALRGAAQVKTLIDGFTFLGNAVGQSSMQIANGIRDITDNAVSMEVALRSASIALTSGFSTTQIQGLSEVARNASIALGRNLGDSIDRLFRGVAKLEPEILDELGIMVRLDTATSKYAATLGKNATELTDFERRQAFLNETLSQGAMKYGSLTDAVDPNPYDQLAAAMANLAEKGLNLINNVLTPFINILGSNSGALTGGLILFASTILTTMIPALGQMAKKQAEVAVTAKAMAAEQAKSGKQAAQQAKISFVRSPSAATTTKGKDFTAVKALKSALKSNTAETGHFNKAQAQVSNTMKRTQAIAKKNKTLNTIAHKTRMAELKMLKAEITKVQNTEKGRGASQGNSALASAGAKGQEDLAIGMTNIQGAGAFEGFKIGGKEFNKFRKTQKAGFKEWKTGMGGKGIFKRFGKSLMGAFKLGSAGARLFGAALMNAIPIIGQILFVGGLLVGYLATLKGEASNSDKALDNLNNTSELVEEKLEQLAETNANLVKTFDGLKDGFRETAIEAQKFQNTLTVNAGIAKEARINYETYTRALADDKGLSKSQVAFRLLGEGARKAGQMIKDHFVAIFETLGKIAKGAFDILMRIPGFSWLGEQAAAAGEAINEVLTEDLDETRMRQFAEAGSAAAGAIMEIVKANKPMQAAFDAANFDPAARFKELSEATDEAGNFMYTFAAAQKIVNKEFRDTTKDLEETSQNLTSLATGLEEVNKVWTKNVDGILKRNSFDKIAATVNTLDNSLTQMMTAGGMSDTEMMNALTKDMGVAGLTFDKLGVSAEEVRTAIAANESPFAGLTKNLEQLGEMTRNTKVRQTALKNELKESASEFKNFDKMVMEAGGQLTSFTAKMNNFKKTGKFEVGIVDNFRLAEQAAARAIKQAEDQAKIKKALITEEYALELFKLKVFKAQAGESGLSADFIAAEAALAKIIEHRNKLVDTEKDAAVNDATGGYLTTITSGGTAGTVGERATTAGEAMNLDGANTGSRLQNMQDAMSPMRDALKELGPEGELIAAAQMGILSIADSFNQLSQVSLKSSEGLQAVGDIIGSIGAIMAANSKSQIAEVDNQIAAEKNRDGKSKESLAKIKAMEKKKEQMARKAFEMNKKMQIAQAVASTASAVVGALAARPQGPWNIALAAMMGVMGLAQVAVIKKSTFQGGASDVPKPTSNISVGKRDNRVDLSKSATSGETAFLRGNKGIGQNANNFAPGGASGMRGYAAGGEGILVGERGPEIVQPTMPIDVIPNNQLGGGTSNVTFTINAVDAQGVHDVLQRQRGNIIGMIREAANEHGEDFMESVNVEAY